MFISKQKLQVDQLHESINLTFEKAGDRRIHFQKYRQVRVPKIFLYYSTESVVRLYCKSSVQHLCTRYK